MNRQITVTSNVQEATYYDKNTQLKTLGTIVVDKYGDENIHRHILKADKNNPFVSNRKKTLDYILGTGSSHLKFVNPSDAQQVLLDRGFEIVKQYAAAGGTDLVTTFKNPAVAYDDIFDFDRDLYATQANGVGSIFRSIELRTSLLIGRMGSTYSEGIYRLVCTNGMVSSIMQLPRIALKHNMFKASEIVGRLDKAGFSNGWSSLPRGPEIGNAKLLSAVTSILEKFSDDKDARKMTKSELPELATFRSSLMQPWVLRGYINQLKLLVNGRSGGSVYAGDLLNAYTGAVSVHTNKVEDNRGEYYALNYVDQALCGTTSLMRMARMFLDYKEIFEQAVPAYHGLPVHQNETVLEDEFSSYLNNQ